MCLLAASYWKVSGDGGSGGGSLLVWLIPAFELPLNKRSALQKQIMTTTTTISMFWFVFWSTEHFTITKFNLALSLFWLTIFMNFKMHSIFNIWYPIPAKITALSSVHSIWPFTFKGHVFIYLSLKCRPPLLCHHLHTVYAATSECQNVFTAWVLVHWHVDALIAHAILF